MIMGTVSTLDFFRNASYEFQVIDSCNKIEPQCKPFSFISITTGNDFKAFDHSYHIFIQNRFP